MAFLSSFLTVQELESEECALKASVIIPTYNRPDLLQRQLACLADQVGDAIEEVLVCDDGSSTDTQKSMLPFEGRIPGLDLLWQEDLGFRAGQARNLGIAKARGDLLIFVDDDVLLPGDFVINHIAAHARHGNGCLSPLVILGFRHRAHQPPINVLPADAEIEASVPDCRVEELGVGGRNIESCEHPWFYVYSCNFSVPRRPEVSFDEDFIGWGMEDIELGYRLVKSGYDVLVEPSARVLHVEAPQPRDPFLCEDRGLLPTYDTYVRNMVLFIDKYPEDAHLRDLLGADLRWYVRDDSNQHWIKDGHEHEADSVMIFEREARRLAAMDSLSDEPGQRFREPLA